MTQTVIAQADINDLSAHIKANKAAIPTSALTTFCKDWPAAKAGLQMLQGVLQYVPGVSMFAGWAIAIVIAAGDAASGAVCPKP